MLQSLHTSEAMCHTGSVNSIFRTGNGDINFNVCFVAYDASKSLSDDSDIDEDYFPGMDMTM